MVQTRVRWSDIMEEREEREEAGLAGGVLAAGTEGGAAKFRRNKNRDKRGMIETTDGSEWKRENSLLHR